MTIIPARQIEEFWNWFVSVSDLLMAGTVEGKLTKQMDRRLRGLHPGLIWEIKPGVTRLRQLTISPNLAANLRGTAQEIIFAAPLLEHWDLSAVRQPKEWNYRLPLKKFGASPMEIDVSTWSFVLLRYS
jgi:hypothetical protein